MESVDKSTSVASAINGGGNDSKDSNDESGRGGGKGSNNGDDRSVDTFASSNNDKTPIKAMFILPKAGSSPVEISSCDVMIIEAHKHGTGTLQDFMGAPRDVPGSTGTKLRRLQDGMITHARKFYVGTADAPFVCQSAKPFYVRLSGGGCRIHSKYIVYGFWLEDNMNEETDYAVDIYFVQQHVLTKLLEDHLQETIDQLALDFQLVLRSDSGYEKDSPLLDYAFGSLARAHIDTIPPLHGGWAVSHPTFQIRDIKKLVKKLATGLDKVMSA